jgi:hypothetical protein
VAVAACYCGIVANIQPVARKRTLPAQTRIPRHHAICADLENLSEILEAQTVKPEF